MRLEMWPVMGAPTFCIDGEKYWWNLQIGSMDENAKRAQVSKLWAKYKINQNELSGQIRATLDGFCAGYFNEHVVGVYEDETDMSQ